MTFRAKMEASMILYKHNVLKCRDDGCWRGKSYPHILPLSRWQENLFDGIRKEAAQYFKEQEIAWHQQKHNLLSSQILCVNLFFPLRQHLDIIKKLLDARFGNVGRVTGIEFEYIGPHKEDRYLGEKGGRGQNRTSSDVTVLWEDKAGDKNALLLEFKFMEPHFGGCSKRPEQDLQLCNSAPKVMHNPASNCYRAKVGRKYWDIALSSSSPLVEATLSTEKYCPFRFDFYQLMRNQLLAHCIEHDSTSGLNRVDFGVIYHTENDSLLNMALPFGGESNPIQAWRKFLKEPSRFHPFTIQELLRIVDRNLPPSLTSWRSYLKARYQI